MSEQARIYRETVNELARLRSTLANIVKEFDCEHEPEEEDYHDTESAFNNGHECASWAICRRIEAALDRH